MLSIAAQQSRHRYHGRSPATATPASDEPGFEDYSLVVPASEVVALSRGSVVFKPGLHRHEADGGLFNRGVSACSCQTSSPLAFEVARFVTAKRWQHVAHGVSRGKTKPSQPKATKWRQQTLLSPLRGWWFRRHQKPRVDTRGYMLSLLRS